MRKLPDGRVYYIDHCKNESFFRKFTKSIPFFLVNKITTWTDPRIAGPVSRIK